MSQATTAQPSAAGFRLVRYFVLASLPAMLLVVAVLVYFGHKEGDFFKLMQREQDAFFARTMDGFVRLQGEIARRDLLSVYEEGNVNLTRLFANTLGEKDFVPFLAKAQRIPIEHCRAIPDAEDAGGKPVQPGEKKACYAGIGRQIMALSEFQALNATVFGTMKKSTVFKIKVYDLRGITVYSSEHGQIGEDKSGNLGWQSAADGKPASELTHRDKFSTFEGVVENRDLISSYLPALAAGSDQIVGVFEVYSDVTHFIRQIDGTSTQIGKLNDYYHALLERTAAANQAKVDASGNLRLAVVLVPLVLLYLMLLQVVRNGKRNIDMQSRERQRTEDALKLSHDQQQALIEAIDGIVWECDARTFKFTFVSPQAERLLGYPAERWTSEATFWRDHIHPDDREWVVSYCAAETREMRSHRLEYRLIAADGRSVWLNDIVSTTVENGVPVKLHGLMVDVTTRKLAEAKMQLQGAALDAAANAILITDREGTILWVNRAFSAVTGYLSEEVIGQNPRLLKSGLHEPEFYRRMFNMLLDGSVWHGEIVNRYKDGRLAWEEMTITPMRGESGEITNYIAIKQDITLRKESERQRERLSAILEASPDFVATADPHGKVLYYNDAARRLLELPQEVDPSQVRIVDTHPRWAAELVLETGFPSAMRDGVWSAETAFLSRSGREIPVIQVILAHKGPDGRVEFLSTIARDISDRKQAETALRRLNEELEDKVTARTVDAERARHEAEAASRAKSMFLAAMSHEIRTPMNGVVGMIDVLQQSSLRGDQTEMVDLIRESAFSLLGIINDILDFSKIEAGKLELEQTAFAPAEAVEGVGSLLNGMAEKKGVTLTLFADPAIPAAVMGDSLRLRQVLINLVNNAIKFCSGLSRAGQVSVRALLVEQSPQQVMVEFQVTDNGIGMDEQTLAQLFTAFTQADASTTRRFGGTGLGLAISSHLVALMGGEITVQSAPDAGAAFKVRLPFMALPAGSIAVAAVSEVAGLSCRVIGGAAGGMADDLAVYLKHAHAVVERVPDLAGARMMQNADRSGLSVWVVDACDESQYLEQLRAARDQMDSDIRFVVVLTERGKRHHPRAAAPNLITVDGHALKRRTFLKAVAIAAGRASLEPEAEVLTSGKRAAVAPSRAEAVRQGRLILVAEDNETNQKVIERQLALLGYTADIAADGREALTRWQSGDYALLLTDLHMPQMDGYELTQAIRAAETGGRRMPIVALSANALKGEAEKCRAVGMDDYRSKPLPLAALEAVLGKWLPIAQSGPLPSTLSGSFIAAPPAAAPVDVNVLNKLVGDDPEFVREFLRDFLRTAIKTRGDLRAACDSGEAKAAVSSAHNLKSLARTVGAFALGELCAAMEEAGKAGDSDALAVLLPRFETELAVVERYLDAL